MKKFFARLRYLFREWLLAFAATLPNDVLSCRFRRAALSLFGFDIAKGALIYRNVLMLGRVQLGTGASISNNSCLNGATAGIFIGRDVMIAPNCCLVAFNHGTRLDGTPMIRQSLTEAPIVIGDDVWIGANCTITAGVTICSGAVIAANSVVIRDVGANEIVGGTPARFIKHRSSDLHA